MISRLPIIKDCIETRFAYFIDPKWYVKKQTHTTHYHEGTTPVPMKICDETIYENIHYTNKFAFCEAKTPNVVSSGIPQFTYETPNVVSSGIPQYQTQTQTPKSIKIPEPLSIENGDTYAHLLAINHRNINEPETQAYYERCMERFLYYWDSPTKPVVGIYIHPTISETEYQHQSNDLQNEFREFYEKTMPKHWSAVFFIMVRTTHPYPITDHIPECLQTIYKDDTNNPDENSNSHSRYIRIYVVYTNRDFVDAGEIFMQNPYIETDAILGELGELRSP
jgi:hypothetical protein